MSDISEKIISFIASRRTLVLSTLDERERPHTSYAPFVRIENDLYILISEAADHTRNLMERPDCSVLLIEDESEAAQIFARRRVDLVCEAKVIGRNDPLYAMVLDTMETTFGEIVTMLKRMQDFHLFALHARSGGAVFGFGEAYRIENAFDRIVPKRAGHAAGQNDTKTH